MCHKHTEMGGGTVAFLPPSADHLVPGFLCPYLCHFYFSLPAPVRALGPKLVLWIGVTLSAYQGITACLSIAVGLTGAGNPVAAVSLRDLAARSSSPFR